MNNKNKPKFAVLLAAFNGAQFIERQINSIISQKNVEVSIFVSIDMSIDKTEAIINKMMKKHHNIFLISKNRKFGNACKNFLFLIKNVNFDSYDFISFSDQDDEWFENKLYNAARALNKNKLNAYVSNLYSVNKKNEVKKIIKKNYPQREWDFLFESAGAGCTYVLSNKIASQLKLDVIHKYEELIHLNHYDWYIYAYVRNESYDWYFDQEPQMLYIQHENNEMGANLGFRAILKRLQMLLSKYWFKESIKIAQILALTNDSFFKKYKHLNKKSFLYLAFNCKKCRRNPRDQIIFFMICLFLSIYN